MFSETFTFSKLMSQKSRLKSMDGNVLKVNPEHSRGTKNCANSLSVLAETRKTHPSDISAVAQDAIIDPLQSPGIREARNSLEPSRSMA
jgi:hypothetical protein